MVVFAGELLEVVVSVELFRMWLGRSVDVRFFFIVATRLCVARLCEVLITEQVIRMF